MERSPVQLSFPTEKEIDTISNYLSSSMDSFQQDFFIRRCFRVDCDQLEQEYIDEYIQNNNTQRKLHFPSFLGVDCLQLKEALSPHSINTKEILSSLPVRHRIDESFLDCLRLESKSRSLPLIHSQCHNHTKMKMKVEVESFYILMGFESPSCFLPKFLIEIETKQDVVFEFTKTETNELKQFIKLKS